MTFLIITKYKVRKRSRSIKIKPFIDPKDVNIKILTPKEFRESKESKLKNNDDDKNRPKDYIIEQLNNKSKNKLIKQTQNVKINIPNDNLIEHDENKVTPYQAPRKYKLPPLPIKSDELINQNFDITKPPPRPPRINELINQNFDITKPPPRPPRAHELIDQNNNDKPPTRPLRVNESIDQNKNDKPPTRPLRVNESIDQNNDYNHANNKIILKSI